MSKKIILGLVFFVFFFGFNVVKANVIINEIMYNPAGTDTSREWIELYNNGSDSVDIVSGKSDSAWRFDDGGTSLHHINDDLNIPAGGYAILASDKNTFLSEYPNFSGPVADTSMTLDNSGTVKIWNGSKDTGSIIDSVSYNSSEGADNDGNSLQLVNGSWIAGTPTPGVQNQSSSEGSNSNDSGNDNASDTSNDSNITSSDDSSVVDDNNDSSVNAESINTSLGDENADTNSVSSSSSNSSKKKTTKIITTIKAKISAKNVGFAGLPVEISTKILGYSNETILYGKYFWNFGDGDSKETTDPTNFSHTYLYPGEYVVSLDYYLSSVSKNVDATSEITIKVLPVNVSISRIGDSKDFFIELTNNSDSKIDISGWYVNANGKIFIFPKNSVILAKSAVIISGKLTGFVLGDQNNLKLFLTTGDVIFDYNSSNQDKIIENKIKNSDIEPVDDISTEANKNTPNPRDFDRMQVPNNNLPAAALLNNSENNPNNYLFFAIFGILLIGASYGIYFIRRKKDILKEENGEDFEIIDE